jgi:hypothetical protein
MAVEKAAFGSLFFWPIYGNKCSDRVWRLLEIDATQYPWPV